MPAWRGDFEPGGHRIQRLIGQIGCHQIDQMADIQAVGHVPGKAVALVLGLKDRQVESNRIADDDRRPGPFDKPCHGACKARRGDDVGVRNRVNSG